MDVQVKSGFLKQADELERKAQAAIRPSYKHHLLMRAAGIYQKIGCPSAARLTRKLAKEALYGKYADQN